MRGYVDWQDPAMEHETDAKMRVALKGYRPWRATGGTHLPAAAGTYLSATGGAPRAPAALRALPNHRDSHLLFSFWIMFDAVGIL